MDSDLRARDVMQTGIISIPVDATLAAAVRTFEDHRISGCPVVDGLGKVVGVLSASDVANTSRLEDGQLSGGSTSYYLADRHGEDEEPEEFLMDGYNSDSGQGIQVQDLMTPRVVSVDPDASLSRVCQVMVEERVHRVMVTEEDALVGIVSSFDVVRAVASAPKAV